MCFLIGTIENYASRSVIEVTERRNLYQCSEKNLFYGKRFLRSYGKIDSQGTMSLLNSMFQVMKFHLLWEVCLGQAAISVPRVRNLSD
ncbi:hypothetical protein BI364_07140 [Acidihalobacter yilgarnensis]|uniref:Uncharacterized protein n=1 Tax=Acidihalobacter yilgarnensis TaxID=2819280 RepID=A0A1D8IMS4_9GAMM|nr:hypothetical protein BI364_07140 [Acidihalobacter yilgarnensis]